MSTHDDTWEDPKVSLWRHLLASIGIRSTIPYQMDLYKYVLFHCYIRLQRERDERAWSYELYDLRWRTHSHNKLAQGLAAAAQVGGSLFQIGPQEIQAFDMILWNVQRTTCPGIPRPQTPIAETLEDQFEKEKQWFENVEELRIIPTG